MRPMGAAYYGQRSLLRQRRERSVPASGHVRRLPNPCHHHPTVLKRAQSRRAGPANAARMRRQPVLAPLEEIHLADLRKPPVVRLALVGLVAPDVVASLAE